MLLKELKRFPKRPVDDNNEYGMDAGRYIGIKFNSNSKERLKKIASGEEIPNKIDPESYHATVAYSRKSNIPGYEVSGKMEEPVEAEIDEFDIFPSENGCNCLVAKLKAPGLEQMHNKTREHGASYDYDDYIPHVTLSYDAGDWKSEDLQKLTQKYKGTKIYGEEEYDSEIIDDWGNKNTP